MKDHVRTHRAPRPKVRTPLAWLVLVACLTASAASAGPRFTTPAAPTQRLFIDNINLTAEDFFAAHMSQTVEERRHAELYLLGVLDATEGSGWCDYSRFKTTTLGEEIFTGFKALEPSRQKARAAHVIVEVLARRFPCQSK